MPRLTRHLALAAAACSAIAVAMPTANAHAHPTSGAARAGSNKVASQVVAYRGKGKAVFANKPGSSKFLNLGSKIKGAPAVAWANGQYFFVADTKRGIEVRTFKTKWAPVVSGGFDCSQPDLASDGHRLGLACLHGKALYAAKFAAPKHGVPSLSKLHLQGGKNLTVGSGAFFQSKRFAFELIAEVYNDDAANWNSHYRPYGKPPLGGGGTEGGDDSFYCRAQATGASAPKHGRIYTGCAIKHKTYYVLSIVSDGVGVCPVMPTAPIAKGRVGIAPITANSAVAVYRTPTGAIAETAMTIDPQAIDCGKDTNYDNVIAKGAKSGPSIALGSDGYR